MTKFKVGDKVRFNNWFSGIVKYYENEYGSSLFLKRDDGHAGRAWEGTKHEGLWWASEDMLELVERRRDLENK